MQDSLYPIISNADTFEANLKYALSNQAGEGSNRESLSNREEVNTVFADNWKLKIPNDNFEQRGFVKKLTVPAKVLNTLRNLESSSQS